MDSVIKQFRFIETCAADKAVREAAEHVISELTSQRS